MELNEKEHHESRSRHREHRSHAHEDRKHRSRSRSRHGKKSHKHHRRHGHHGDGERGSRPESKHRRHHKERRTRSPSSSSAASSSSDEASDRSRQRHRDVDPDIPSESTGTVVAMPDWSAANEVVSAMLSDTPDLRGDLKTVLQMLDDGGAIDLAGMEDPFMKSGIQALLLSLRASVEGTTFSKPSGAHKRYSSWFESSFPPRRVLGPARPSAFVADEAGSVPVAAPDEDDDDVVGPFPPGDPRARITDASDARAATRGGSGTASTSNREEWMTSISEGFMNAPVGKPQIPKRLRIENHGLGVPAQEVAAAPSGPKSLVDICKEKSAAEAAAAKPGVRRPFDREKDLQIRRPVDASKAIEQMTALNSRFGTSGTYSSFI